MLKKFLPKLIERTFEGDKDQSEKQKSAIILVSSLTEDLAAPNLATYCASKAYVSYLGIALHHEIAALGNSDNVDF